MNARIPELANQLESLLGTYEKAKIAVAQAPSGDRVELEHQANIISIEIEGFFAADGVKAAIVELREKRSEDYEMLGLLFVEGKLSDKEVDEYLESIEFNPEYRLLNLAGEIGRFSLKDIEVTEIDELGGEDTAEYIYEFDPELLSDESDLEPEEVALLSELKIDYDEIEETDGYESTIIVEAELSDVEEPPIDTDELTEDIIEPTLDTLLEVEAPVQIEATKTQVSEPEENVATGEEPEIKVEELPSDAEIFTKIPDSEAITQETASVIVESIVEQSEIAQEIGVKLPQKDLLKALYSRKMTSEERAELEQRKPHLIKEFFERFDSEDPQISLLSSIEQTAVMYDFVDYVLDELSEDVKRVTLKESMLAKLEVSEAIENQAIPETPLPEEPVVEEDPAQEAAEKIEATVEPHWAPPLKDAVAEALGILEADNALFDGQIRLDEFQSMTNSVDINAFHTAHELTRAGLIEKETTADSKPIMPEISLTDAVLMMVYKTNNNLLGKSSRSTQAKAVALVEEEVQRHIIASKEIATGSSQVAPENFALAA